LEFTKLKDRDSLLKLSKDDIQKLIGVSANLWLNIPRIEKLIEERSRSCRDCGCPYEDKPFDRGKYEGDNEPLL